MNSPLSISPQRLLLQNYSPNVPVFGENMNPLDVMKMIAKYDQLTVQDEDLDGAWPCIIIICIITIISMIIIIAIITYFE